MNKTTFICGFNLCSHLIKKCVFTIITKNREKGTYGSPFLRNEIRFIMLEMRYEYFLNRKCSVIKVNNFVLGY